MPKEIIFALVLAVVYLGALAWLVVYSRLQHRKAVRAEQSPEEAPSAAETTPQPAAVTRHEARDEVRRSAGGVRLPPSEAGAAVRRGRGGSMTRRRGFDEMGKG